jgi:hypothetical protein
MHQGLSHPGHIHWIGGAEYTRNLAVPKGVYQQHKRLLGRGSYP